MSSQAMRSLMMLIFSLPLNLLGAGTLILGCAPQSHKTDVHLDQKAEIPARPSDPSNAATQPSEDASTSRENVSVEESDTTVGAERGDDPATSQSGCALAEVSDPQWWHDAVGYEIFVRSFQDSDGDGFGDLQGLHDRLSYLLHSEGETSLGVDLVWLMPILESPSYHGYDVQNYDAIDEDYGSVEDLKSLLSSADDGGIRFLMDFVMNHSSHQHPWFIASAQEPSGEMGNYYTWASEPKEWSQPWGSANTWHGLAGRWFYGLFSSSMPDWNILEPAVENALTASASTWLSGGLHGFRLDAVRYLAETGEGPGQKDQAETHAIWNRFRKAMDAATPNPLLVGEAWADVEISSSYFGTEEDPEMNMVFDFDGASAMLAAVQSGSSAPLKSSWCARWKATPPHGSWGTFLSNHDQDRVATVLFDQGDAALRTAAALLLLSPGTPWIYYGEEIGALNGSSWGDMARREPMHWDKEGNGFTAGEPWAGSLPPNSAQQSVEEQWEDPGSLLRWYQTLIRARRAHSSLRRGSASWVSVEPDAMVLLREDSSERCVVVVPLSSASSSYTLSHESLEGNWTSEGSGGVVLADNGTLNVEVELGGARLLCRPVGTGSP